ncbi:MAG: NAD-dependent dehydratase [Bacteroidetes bacterium]|nr:MAG: NAD-dependent dehydratase [Bacteroidota bacterium]
MVLGNGLVANGFKRYEHDDRFLIFASGVSNSANREVAEFVREQELLEYSIRENQHKTLVYFGTCSVYDPVLNNSPYVIHKLAMEKLIRENHSDYFVFRISNLAGNTSNPHTVLNFFVQHIISGQFFYLWKNASRNIIDMEDAFAICDRILQKETFKNEIINIANPANYAVTQIVGTIEKLLGKKGNYELIEKGSNPVINTDAIRPIISELGIQFDSAYLCRTIEKYFG